MLALRHFLATKSNTHPMNIAGVLIHTLPEHIATVSATVTTLTGVEIHAVENGKLVLTVEHDDPKQVADTITELSRMEHVLTAAMVYEYSDKEEQANEAKQT